ncbi:MAG: hypothetical protein ABWY64_21775 [Tardiphaga sp.]
MLSNAISFLRDHLFTMPVLAKFAVGMVMLVIIPRLSRRLHIPVPAGLLLSGFIGTRSGVLSDSLTGVGDLYPLVTLKWNQGDAHIVERIHSPSLPSS